MKAKMFVATIALLGVFLISGCANVNLADNLAKWNPLAKKEKVTETTVVKKAEPPKSGEEIVKLVDKKIAEVVESINVGNWNEGIRIGEEAFAVIIGSDAQAVVKDSAYGLDSSKEKLYETLGKAYDYKTHMEGLTTEEKDNSLRTAKAHLDINPADPYKKLSFAKVLIDTGAYAEGLKLTTELYNSSISNKDVTEQYAWALYLSGRKSEAYNMYMTIYPQAETLTQLYHSAIVIEEQNKLLGLLLYKGCIGAGNNLMVLEPNVKNLSAQSYINSVITGSQKAFDRLLAGGLKIDSPYNLATVEGMIKSIVNLSAQ